MGAAEDHPGESSVWDDSAAAFRRWQAGQGAALDDLVRLLTPVLWQVVRAYDLDRERAEDVVQTTWLALVRGGAKIEDPQAVGAWLTITARRQAWRQSRLESRSAPVSDEVVAELVAPTSSAEHVVVERDENDRLWQGVGRLSGRCQRLLRVIAFSPRPNYTELAGELEMPVGSIGPTRGRCLDKLRTLLLEPVEGENHVRV